MPQPVVVFPDTEAYICGYLDETFPDFTDDPITVTNRAPTGDETWPARLVVIRRDGGRREHLLEYPRLGVRIWAADDATATDLALLTASLIVACPDGVPVVRAAQLSGPSSLPEENGKALRYCTFDLICRGTTLVPA